jgi:hypothetical protein|tara:strand:- start:15 stop:140 length:126 start_codon:yes stop_codon:yes gene_type:complete
MGFIYEETEQSVETIDDYVYEESNNKLKINAGAVVLSSRLN